MKFTEILKQVPVAPGVYFFKDYRGQIIYIGKAKILKNRVRSYFSGTDKKDTKTQALVKNIATIEWIVVRDEVEALLTETNLIKEHRPKYNIFMKDDKSFPYLRITNEPYPKIEIIRSKNLQKDGHKYYGPFTDTRYLRETLSSIHKIFPLRTCDYVIDANLIRKGTVKVCLDYHIKQCEGPCEGLVSQAAYHQMIHKIEQFIKGKNDHVKQYLQRKMDDASQSLQFEDAIRYREQLRAIDHFTRKQKKITQDFIDRDVVVVSAENQYGVGVVMRVRNGLFIGRERFDLQVPNPDLQDEILNQFLVQFYTATADIPKEILTDLPIRDKEYVEMWLSALRGNSVKLFCPTRGEKSKLVQICKRNADLLLGDIRLKKIKRKDVVSKKVLQLQADLDLKVPPRRIEAFDNSNFQGDHPVASMVCFVDGKPKKTAYRKYSIKSVQGIDDFASMKEIITRRYTRVKSENLPFPDLILVDGGKGQLSAAFQAICDLNLSFIPIIGLAKRLEDVYKPGMRDPQNISKTSPGLFLLRNIRDEAHRFAITYHRQKRDEGMTLSILEDLPGMGKRRVQKLWQQYASISAVLESNPSTIHNKTGIPENIASQVIEKLATIELPATGGKTG